MARRKIQMVDLFFGVPPDYPPDQTRDLRRRGSRATAT